MAKQKPKPPVDPNKLLESLLQIIDGEVSKIQNNQTANLLDSKVSQQINDYAKTLIAVKRESRQNVAEEELEKMDDATLEDMAKQASKLLLKPKKDSKS